MTAVARALNIPQQPKDTNVDDGVHIFCPSASVVKRHQEPSLKK